jgi:hypothetical protein
VFVECGQNTTIDVTNNLSITDWLPLVFCLIGVCPQ